MSKLEKERDLIRSLVEQGLSVQQIAMAIGVTKQAVSNRLKRMGLSAQQDPKKGRRGPQKVPKKGSVLVRFSLSPEDLEAANKLGGPKKALLEYLHNWEGRAAIAACPSPLDSLGRKGGKYV